MGPAAFALVGIAIVSLVVARYERACAAAELDSICAGHFGCWLTPPSTDHIATAVVRDVNGGFGCSGTTYALELVTVHYDAEPPATLPRRLHGRYTMELEVGNVITTRVVDRAALRTGDRAVVWFSYNEGYPRQPWQTQFITDIDVQNVLAPIGDFRAEVQGYVDELVAGAGTSDARLATFVDYTRRGTACFWASPREDARGCDDFSYGYSGSPDVPDSPGPRLRGAISRR